MKTVESQPTIKTVIEYAERLEHWIDAGVNRFVYFVQEETGGPVKIGVASDPLHRLGMLQCGNPRRLVLREFIPSGHEVETQLHDRFHEQRVSGEWFEWPEVILAFAGGLSDRVFAYHVEHRTFPVAWSLDWEPLGVADMEPLVREAKHLRCKHGGGWGRRMSYALSSSAHKYVVAQFQEVPA